MTNPEGTTRRGIIGWWEARRLRFNVHVVLAFLASLAVTEVFDRGSFTADLADWTISALIFLIFANLCYCFGWVVDTAAYKAKPRMRLYRVGVFFSILVACAPGIWAIVRYSSGYHAHPVNSAISRQLHSGAAQVDLTELARFDWDQVYVFGPYMPKSFICAELKLSGVQCTTAGISDVDEGENLLVFMKQGNVVDVESTGRAFDEKTCMDRPIARGDAKFVVRRDQNMELVCK